MSVYVICNRCEDHEFQARCDECESKDVRHGCEGVREQLAALREVEKAAREMFPYIGKPDQFLGKDSLAASDAIRPGKRRPLFDALTRLDAVRGKR